MRVIKNTFILLPIVLLALLAGCAGKTAAGKAAPDENAGGEKDAHGCLIEAGYSWCQKKKSCVHPWEVVEGKATDFKYEDFVKFCTVEKD